MRKKFAWLSLSFVPLLVVLSRSGSQARRSRPKTNENSSITSRAASSKCDSKWNNFIDPLPLTSIWLLFSSFMNHYYKQTSTIDIILHPLYASIRFLCCMLLLSVCFTFKKNQFFNVIDSSSEKDEKENIQECWLGRSYLPVNIANNRRAELCL